MKKVLHGVALMNRGGQETLLMSIFRCIDREKISFDFLCTINAHGEYDDEIRELGGEIYCINQGKPPVRLKSLQNAWREYRWLKSHPEYSILHIHTHHAYYTLLSVLAAKAAGVREVIVHSHNASTVYHPVAHRVAKIPLQLMPVKRFACSREAGNWLFGSREYTVIKNGIITADFTFDPEERGKVRKELSWEGKKIIGHVGRFNDQKNHIFLLQIFKELHRMDDKTHLVLAGSGETEQMIKQFITENGLTASVTLLGVRDDINRLYQGMDLFLFPSKFEGLGIVLIEAQTAGLPCLISDTVPKEVDITEYIHRGSLNLPAEEWAQKAKEILDGQAPRRDTTADIVAAGYDIATTAMTLQEYYLKCV